MRMVLTETDKPFDLLKGGVYDVNSDDGWHQITAEGEPHTYAMRPRIKFEIIRKALLLNWKD